METPSGFEPQKPQNELLGQIKSFLFEAVKIIVISLAIIIPIRYFVIQPFYVKGASMEPNFYDREYLIIDEISYRFDNPERGDVIVFRYPKDPKQFFIKRVIGMPGETVKIENGDIYIKDTENQDGYLLDESSYLPKSYTQGTLETQVEWNEYFVLGDNRSSSLDSRVFGAISRDYIVGRAWIRGWPIERAEVIK